MFLILNINNIKNKFILYLFFMISINIKIIYLNRNFVIFIKLK